MCLYCKTIKNHIQLFVPDILKVLLPSSVMVAIFSKMMDKLQNSDTNHFPTKHFVAIILTSQAQKSKTFGPENSFVTNN